MELKRRKVAGTSKAKYPTHEEARSDRRRFLNLLGRGLLAAPLLGVAGCEFGSKKKLPVDAAADAVLEPDYTLGGVAPDSIGVEPDNGPDWNLSGGAPMDPDVRTPPDKDYQVQGDLGIDVGTPDTCTRKPDAEGEFPPLPGEAVPDVKPQPDTTEEDVPPLAGDMPAPDVTPQPQQDAKGEVDAEEPPLDGDMPAPGF
ncbi:MAG: hypothetical protein FJ109_21215 [Deltaproteobacteria bacterium]|nr:hypothetical protein [Deltaproteobacteria bacterium]